MPNQYIQYWNKDYINIVKGLTKCLAALLKSCACMPCWEAEDKGKLFSGSSVTFWLGKQMTKKYHLTKNPSSAQNSPVSFLPSLQLLRMFLLQPHTKIMVQLNMFTWLWSEVCALLGWLVICQQFVLSWAEVGLCLTTVTSITEIWDYGFGHCHIFCWYFNTVEKHTGVYLNSI